MMVLVVVVVGACMFVLGIAIGCVCAAAARPVPNDLPGQLAELSDAHRRLHAERAYSEGLRATLTDQRLTIGELRARIDIGRVAS